MNPERTDLPRGRPPSRNERRAVWGMVWLLVTIVMVFVVIRVSTDVRNLSSGTIPPPGDFNRGYALHPVVAYLHIVPGVIYLLGATAQLSSRIRSRAIRLHRRLGRFVLSAGILTGAFAIAVGLIMPFGGTTETIATVVFGTYFLACLTTAFRAIRTRDVAAHRRWMIRAFAIGASIGTVRVLVGILQVFGRMALDDAFGMAFWVSFLLHGIGAELWLGRGSIRLRGRTVGTRLLGLARNVAGRRTVRGVGARRRHGRGTGRPRAHGPSDNGDRPVPVARA